MTIIFAIVLCILFHIFFHSVAHRWKLIESSGGRKTHSGLVPLVGGISIYCSSLIYFLFFSFDYHSLKLIALLFPVVCVGVVDDILNIPAKIRLGFQISFALLLIAILDIRIPLTSLLFSGKPLVSAELIIFIEQTFTLVFIVSLMNAINMIDGMDGLAGIILLFAFCAIAYLRSEYDISSENQFLYCTSACICVFLYFNFLRKPGFRFGKVFLGDAGSMFLGALLAIYLVEASTPGTGHSNAFPICAWFVFLPAADMFSTVIIRILRGRSPLEADRTHIHHVLLNAGLTGYQVLLALGALHLLCILAGIWIMNMKADPVISIFLLIIFFLIYLLARVFALLVELNGTNYAVTEQLTAQGITRRQM